MWHPDGEECALAINETRPYIVATTMCINRIDRGNANLSFALPCLRKIASIFDVSTDYLLGKSKIRNPLKAYEIIKEKNPELYEAAMRETEKTYERNIVRGIIREYMEPAFTEDEMLIIDIFRGLNGEGREVLLNTAKGLSVNNAYSGEVE